MKHLATLKGISSLLLISFISSFSFQSHAQAPGRIAERVTVLAQQGVFKSAINLFEPSTDAGVNQAELKKSVKDFTLASVNGLDEILSTAPEFLKFRVPVADGAAPLQVLLFKETISSNGFSLLTSDKGAVAPAAVVHYKGAIENDRSSLAAFSFSAQGVMGFVSNDKGNYVIGALETNPGTYIIYNDKSMIAKNAFDCGTDTNIPLAPGNYLRGAETTSALTSKCVNWYWETDYDLYTAKGSSLANVNSYMQGIFNQVSTLYANDGISITLKTLYVWTTTDPFTGTSTSGYLDQFGVTRTSFDGDLATLIGTKGGGGIAWINGLCNSQKKYRMAYCGISTNYSAVPSYSWTVEVITHEQGHNLGSRHTHDCVWNGNNTKIDGCGDAAGYTSGTCAVPAAPAGGGTIMSYCHLTSTGINFNLGFGPQPKTLITNNINNAACLVACAGSCSAPAQPATITGSTTICASGSQSYSVAAVSGATSYSWTLPAGWSGSSSTNTITVNVGSSGGIISVSAINSCGTGTPRTATITVTALPAQPGSISGNFSLCPGTSQTYAVPVVAGASSYTWTLPSGWIGSSTTNSITVTAGNAGGNITVKANNSCGSGTSRSQAATITAAAPVQPSGITGNATVCPGSSQTYSVPAVAGAGSYAWTLPSGWSGSSTTNSISVMAGTSGGNLSVIAINGCGNSPSQTLAVSAGGAAPATPETITVSGGASTVCTGDSRTYSVPAISGNYYNWSLPTGINIVSGQGSASLVVSVTASFVSPGAISVTAANSCGISAAQSITVSKAVIARPGTISVSGGAAKVCAGDVRTYNVASVAGMTYDWVPPAGAVINSGQGTSSVNISFNSNFTANGILSVRANNQCGTSDARTLSIVRNVISAPGIISGPSTVCRNSIGNYSVPAVAGATGYAWTIPTGGVVQGASNGSSISILWTSSRGGNLSVRALNNCGASGSRSIKITIACSSGMEESLIASTYDVTAFPNPATNQFQVKFVAPEAGTYSYTLTDLAGKKMISRKVQAFKGIIAQEFDVSSFSRGTYIMVVERKNFRQALKINVQ